MEELPAFDSEIKAAVAEGVSINPQVLPVGFDSEGGRVCGLRCVRVKQGDRDESGHKTESVIEASDFAVEVDTVIMAIGGEPDTAAILKQDRVDLSETGEVKADPITFATSRTGVFAGGDVRTGPLAAISAMSDGKKAAAAMDRFIRGENVQPLDGSMPESRSDSLPDNIITREREKVRMVPAELRKTNFREIDQGFGPQEAIKEAGRCLKCRTCNRCMTDFGCVAITPTENHEKVSPVVDTELCVGCQVCIQVCPYGYIQEET
jgi:NADPH-dependent glutamate synthase beta subunit-like oxidoreductase